MTCQAIVETLPAFADGDLPADQMTAIQQHLATCPACAAEQTALAHTWAMLDEAPAVSVAADFGARFWAQARTLQPDARPADLPCSQVLPNLAAWSEGDVPAALGAAIEQHLDHCTACVAERTALDETWALVGAQVPGVPVASDFNHRFWKRVEAQPVSVWTRLAQTFRAPARAVAVFAVMMVLLVSVYGTRSQTPPQPPQPTTPQPPTTATITAPEVPEDDAHYGVLGDVGSLVPDLDDSNDTPTAAPPPKKASSDEQIDKVLEDMPLDGGPQS